PDAAALGHRGDSGACGVGPGRAGLPAAVPGGMRGGGVPLRLRTDLGRPSAPGPRAEDPRDRGGQSGGTKVAGALPMIPYRLLPVCLLAALLPLGAGRGVPPQGAGPPAKQDAPSPAEIERLVQQLGSPTFKEREAARKALADLGEAAW